MKFVSLWCLPLCLFAGFFPNVSVRAAERPSGPLPDYVAKPDSSYRWQKKRSGQLSGTYAELILTSQRWRGIVWKHQLFVIKPENVRPGNQHALLYITGGGWDDRLENGNSDAEPGDEIRALARFAEQAGTPVAILKHVPQQPLFGGMYEDAIIAYTFEQYLRTGETDWPLLLPMVKSAVRAMDAVQEFTRQEWALDIKTFTVTGASKRGWTTWLTSAVDRRVTALAPMVIDMLNMGPQLRHQQEVWGKPSYKIHDYTDRGLDEALQTAPGRVLQQIVDPYSYRDAIPQPKLILLGTNDHYWPLDALNQYWSDLSGEKYILYVPNNGHGLDDYRRVFGSLNALHQHAAAGRPLPKLSWEFSREDGRTSLRVRSEPAAAEVVAWVATSPTRDFREATWRSVRTRSDGQVAVYDLPVVDSGYAALFGEAQYAGDELPFYLSTNVRVVPAEEAP